MGSPLSKPEPGFCKSSSKPFDGFINPRSNIQTTGAPASSARTSSPRPELSANHDMTSQPILAPGSVLATAGLVTPRPATAACVPNPAPSTSPPVKPATGSPSALISHSTRNSSTTGAWAILETSLRALHGGVKIFPPVHSAVGSIIECIDVMQQLSEKHNGGEELASELTRLSNLIVRHMEQSNSLWMSDAVADAARGIEEQVKIIESRRNRGAGRRLVEASVDEELIGKCFRLIGSLFRELQADAGMCVWKVVNEQTANSQLDRLHPVLLAKYDSTLSTTISRRTCTAGTRTAILSGLDTWSRDFSQADIYWMNGMAGTGKTTIACTFSESLRRREQLAASFFCSRTVPECRAATRILPTIAYQLARYSPQFRSALCRSLEEDPDVSTANLTRQFDLLLKEPLTVVKEAMPSHLVVVIDVLDECDDMLQVELLLRILLKGVKGLPIRFFVTSRPEPEVYNRMTAYDEGSRGVLHLHEVEESLVHADIELYLQEELEPMSPKPADIQKLVERSGTLFIYAATLVRYIEPDNPMNNPARRLQSVLSAAYTSAVQHSVVDTLYSVVLNAALNEEGRDAAEVMEVRCVLQTVVCPQAPLPMESLTVMAKLDDKAQTLAALQRLRAVIHVSETSEMVSTLHASFPDYMFSKTRSKGYHCNSAAVSSELAQRCFEVMSQRLRFNICNLESSFVRDDQVEDLNKKITQAVSPVLWYACQFWGVHLANSDYSDLLCFELEKFLLNQPLFWMEVMNLERKMGTALELLGKARSWISKTSAVPKDATTYVEDARKFISSFAANPVSQSTPHIYVSALPFCPKSSFVYEHYYTRMKGLIKVAGSAFEESEAAMVACWTVESPVYSITRSPNGAGIAYGCSTGAIAIRSAIDGILVAGSLEGHAESVLSIDYSPDSSRMVTSSADKTVRIWNTKDGTLAIHPLKGHTEHVVSVAYSPDGTRVVSGSDDHTIRVWDAQDGTPVGDPLEGHTRAVWAVAYSPDGSRVVSGSADNTIRIWDSRDGAPVAGPLEGHTKAVRSVAYSPDGAYIASGSYDHTIRVWRVIDGTIFKFAALFDGHTGSVRLIAYSPDGTRIISGSGDKTIRVWNAQDGSVVAGPLEGHTQGVTSVAYSRDGSRIISGSYDSTIRVWDPKNAPRAARKPNNHTDWVRSVAYSPDGTHIVTGSSDHTIRIWHAHNGLLAAGPLKGHTNSVRSVTYSLTGTRIVSGSDDHTIRVWNANDGALVVGPLDGHAASVRSVGYSPNGTRIVSGSDDFTVRVWNAEHGTAVFEGHTDCVTSVVYSPCGTHIASGSQDRTIRVWNAHDGTLDVGPLVGHSDYVNSVAYSPDGTRIASGSGDWAVRVWDAKDGALVAGPFKGHTDYVRSVGYSPDGTRIVSGSGDRTIRIWNVSNGTCTLVTGPLHSHAHYILSVAYSPDGTHIVSSSADRTIRVWSVPDGASVSSLQAEGHADGKTTESSAEVASTDSSGWVTASDSGLLLWVPPEVQPRDMLSQLRCQMVIGRTEPLFVEYGDLVLGRRWAECYRPENFPFV